MSAHATLGLLLVREGLVGRPQLYDALRLQRQTGRLLGTCLLSLGYVTPAALLAVLSRQLGIPALPPGALERASAEAVARVPRDVALRLRILPYSWDGKMLGVAVADGKVLGQLQEVAYHSRSAVGAYVALETEIEAVLEAVYPATPGSSGGPRVVNASDLGPTVLTTPLVLAEAAAADVSTVIARPPPRVELRNEALERVGFFDAVERLYEATTPEDVGRMVGRALLNYFLRVLVLLGDGQRFRVVGRAGMELRRVEVPESAMPLTVAKLGGKAVSYGHTTTDVRPSELAGVFGFEPGNTGLLASVGAKARPRLVVLADNGTSRDLYEDLHDVELLIKEAETGLAMLLDQTPSAPSTGG